MTPGSMTPAERREAVHASLAHRVLKPMPPDPKLAFRVDLNPRRRPLARSDAIRKNDTHYQIVR